MVGISRKTVGIAAVVGFVAIANVAAAQMGSGPGGGGGQGYGYGMMNGYPGMGPGMMEGWNGQGPGTQGAGRGVSIQNRLDALKTELNITAGEVDAWNSYTAPVTSARNDSLNAMRSIWQPNSTGAWGPDQRFADMDKMVKLMKQGYEQEKKAADALLPHLTAYQQGQAKEILPVWPIGGHVACGAA